MIMINLTKEIYIVMIILYKLYHDLGWAMHISVVFVLGKNAYPNHPSMQKLWWTDVDLMYCMLVCVVLLVQLRFFCCFFSLTTISFQPKVFDLLPINSLFFFPLLQQLYYFVNTKTSFSLHSKLPYSPLPPLSFGLVVVHVFANFDLWCQFHRLLLSIFEIAFFGSHFE